MGFGAIIVNLPGSAIAADGGIIRILYDCGIANEFSRWCFSSASVQ